MGFDEPTLHLGTVQLSVEVRQPARKFEGLNGLRWAQSRPYASKRADGRLDTYSRSSP